MKLTRYRDGLNGEGAGEMDIEDDASVSGLPCRMAGVTQLLESTGRSTTVRRGSSSSRMWL